MHSLSPHVRASRRAPRPGRRGIALFYLCIATTALVAICSLAVDFGRWELCKTQMQRAADAGARAGAFQLITDYSAAASLATAVANENYVDAQTVGSDAAVTLGVQMLLWVGPSDYTVLMPANYAMANAVRVTLTYDVPLSFAGVIGLSKKTATRSATAMLVTQSQTLYVYATGDPWLAGEPTDTLASRTDPNWQGQQVNPLHPWQHDYAGPVGGQMADGQPYSSPAQVGLTLKPGAFITVSNVTGTANCAPGYFAEGTADGTINGVTSTIDRDYTADHVAEHGIADIDTPDDSLNAVFLGSGLPDGTAAPSVLSFGTQAARDYTTLSPQLKQPYFVGNGQTTGGNRQVVVVPQGATRMFLGVMDGWEWDNNTGGYNATVTQMNVMMVQ
jgi:Flp pilus assembly protein TadG